MLFCLNNILRAETDNARFKLCCWWPTNSVSHAELVGCDQALFVLCTVTTGIDNRYAEQLFYKKDFGPDSKRIESLFEIAMKSSQTFVFRKSISQERLLDLLGHSSVAILALVDARGLRCNCIRHKNSNSFLGHFIVLWSYKNNVIWYSDPSSPSHGTELLQMFNENRH